MEEADVLVIGGGPAGSTCAKKLTDGGLDVLVVDQAVFPRVKVCAGWITPGVVHDLELQTDEYRQGRVFQPMTGFRVGRIGGPSRAFPYGRPVSFGICRREFDDYLLRRSGARLELGQPVKTIRRNDGHWTVNERYQAPLLVAAAGHCCPVARLLKIGGPERGSLIAAQEFEVELSPAQQSACPIEPELPEIYFCDDLLGYGWCIRKGNCINVGLGRADRQQVPRHVREFYEYLTRLGRVPEDLPGKFRGHAYLLYDQSTRPLVADGIVWIGDSAGLAHQQSGEGIHPAIQSALMAAETILDARGDYCRRSLQAYRLRMEAHFGTRSTKAAADRTLSGLKLGIARWLFGQRWFCRRVVLDRWFLR